MSKINFTFFWDLKWQKEFNIPKGFLVIKPREIYKKNLGNYLKKLNELQEKKGELRELESEFEYHYQKRSIKQLHLSFALYTIEANEMNAGMQGSKEYMVTANELYENDLKDYAPRVEIKIPEVQYNFYRSNYRVEKEVPIKNADNKIIGHHMILIESFRHFSTIQMAQWIDRQFNRMAVNGISCTNPGDIYYYWVKWKEFLNHDKIILHDQCLTLEEYRILNPICEATGRVLLKGEGHICHIKARGMGGNHEQEKDYSSNLLHLCHEAHIEIQHKKGWSHFLKLYPYLKYKVETALKRNYTETGRQNYA
jgi:hypothetical protein